MIAWKGLSEETVPKDNKENTQRESGYLKKSERIDLPKPKPVQLNPKLRKALPFKLTKISQLPKEREVDIDKMFNLKNEAKETVI